jgi:hypothetical protein
VVAVVLFPLATVSPGGADTASWSNAQPARFAPGVQNLSPNDSFDSVSCSGLTCVAAGEFLASNGYEQAVTESSGDGGVTWGLAQPVTLPAGVLTPSDPGSYFDAVSCSGSDCVAAGYFDSAADSYQAMTATTNDGGATWSVAQPVNSAAGLLSPSSPYTFFLSVSCSGSSCVAAGYFVNANGQWQAMTDTSSDGGSTWSLIQPTNVPNTEFSEYDAVSCSGSTCVAAGYFVNASDDYQALTDTSSDGGTTWNAAQPVNISGGVLNTFNPSSFFNSVSCWGLNCVAAGYFYGANGNMSVTDTSSDGGVTWGLAQPTSFAANIEAASPSASFDSISCSGVICVAAGQLYDVNGSDLAFTDTSSDGGVTWAVAQTSSFAAGVQYALPQSYGFAVSCSSSTCVTAGEFEDVNGADQAFTDTSGDGGVTWANAQPASFAVGVQDPTRDAAFEGVSCSSSTCVAAGEFADVNGNDQAMSESNLIASPPDKVTNLGVTQSGAALSATWSPSVGATSYVCTLLYGFNAPSTFTTTSMTSTCTFNGLSTSTPYGVSVVAIGPDGTSGSVSAFGTPTPTTTTTIHKVPRPVVRTIVCVRAKKIKRVRGVHPTCPAGYKKR